MDFRSLLLEAGIVENNNWNPRKARWYTGELLDQVQAHFETVVGYKAASISEAAYFCYHGMEALPSCLKCASPVKKYVCFADGYRDYCSVKCAKSDPKIIEQTKKTSMDRYGVSNVSKSSKIKAKRSETMKERYGDEVYYRTDDFKEKSKATLIDRYGVDHQMLVDEVKQKVKDTARRKYAESLTYFPQRNITDDGRRILSSKENLEKSLKASSIVEISEQCGVTQQTIYSYCSKYQIPRSRSSYEVEISNWLAANNIEFATNKRIGGLEIDFVMGNVGIEFNGLYYHTVESLNERGVVDPKDYHKRKNEACEAAGIRLLMINEDEWIDRKDAIKGKILNLCGRSEKGIGGRKLRIEKIDNSTAHRFVDRHHIQGKTAMAIASYGAFDGESLVAAMQFNRQRGTGAVELIRFCSDGRTYAGVFSKMFKRAREAEGYTEVLSFADLRYSDGGVYEKNGFTEVARIPPDYRYVKGSSTFHKSSFTKTQIAKKFDIDMSLLTEGQAMRSLGFGRIYDCGKIKYVWTA